MRRVGALNAAADLDRDNTKLEHETGALRPHMGVYD